MSSSKQIRWGALLSYISIATNILSGLVYTPWMVACIGESQYGLYTLANSVISLFLMDFGLSSATGRYLSKFHAEGDRKGAECFLGAVYKLYLLIDAAILVILVTVFFLMDHIFVNLTAPELKQFRVVYAISAVFSVVNFPFVAFDGILTAYEKFIPLKVAGLLYRVFHVILTVIALLMGYGLYTLVTVHAAVGLTVVAFKYIIIKKTVPIRTNFRAAENGIYKDIFGFSIWVTVSSLAGRLIFNITPSVLAIAANSTAIAVFGIISTIESYAFSITTAINGLFMPKISRIVANDQSKNELNSLFLNVGRFQYFLNGLIIAGFSVVGRDFIVLWMGEKYDLAYWGILLVLIPGLFYNALQIANTTMVVENKVKVLALVSVVTGLVNVSLSFPLAYHYGVIGACASISIAYFVRAVMSNFIYNRVLPVDVPRFIKDCYLRMSLPMILTVTCGIFINRCIPDGGWVHFLMKGTIVVFIYCFATFFLCAGKKEKETIFRWMKK